MSDSDVLNFLLNLEYLLANFYFAAVFGTRIPDASATGLGTQGTVTGAYKQVSFTDPIVSAYAREIAQDHIEHVNFLRTTLGSLAVAQPSIDVSANGVFTPLAIAAGLIVSGQTFDAFANDLSFLLGAFYLNDAIVTAYQGALLMITANNTTSIAARGGMLAVEAYHAAIIRTELYTRGAGQAAGLFANLRGALGGGRDQGILVPAGAGVAPLDPNGATFSRTPGQVLNILYGAVGANAGLFFPSGINGTVNSGMTA